MNQYEDKVYASLKLNIKISNPSGETVHQEEKDIRLEMGPEDFKKIERQTVAIGDVIPLVEGKFKIDALLRNTNSKEFSSLEDSVDSPLSGNYSLSPILFLFNETTIPQRSETVAFLFHDHRLYPNTQRLYTRTDELLMYFEIYNRPSVPRDSLLRITVSQGDAVKIRNEEPLGDQTFYLRKFRLQGFQPGYYGVYVSVVGKDGKEILKGKGEFIISPLDHIPRPWSFSKIYPPLDHSYFSTIRAYEYLGLENYDRAIQEIENFYDRAKPHKELAKLLAKAYFGKKDFKEVIDILTPLRDTQDFEILELTAKSYFFLNDYANALDVFKKALATGGEVVEIINLVGYSYLKLNNPREALNYFQRSLKLNSNQPEIKEIVEKIKKS
jgi:tetratricopeptide (TPR) repeat protein